MLGCDRVPKSPPAAQTPKTSSLKTPSPSTLENKTMSPSTSHEASANVPTETAVLAGGCFWGMEDILRKIPGVLHTEVGYAGGTTASPDYNAVKTGTTGHAESIQIVFDPSKLSYATLLERWFYRMHDPTTENRQGNDRGSQYRSAIFYLSDEQKRVALEVTAKVNQSGWWPRPIVTQIVAAGPFTQAEDYHQDYLEKHPGGYTCHFLRDEPVY
jgi:peptide methionine sulfoxide reductase msrA/msrB